MHFIQKWLTSFHSVNSVILISYAVLDQQKHIFAKVRNPQGKLRPVTAGINIATIHHDVVVSITVSYMGNVDHSWETDWVASNLI
jgi:hypothetical protein